MIAEHLSSEEAAGIKEGFDLMDTGNNGKINIDELREGLKKLGHQIPDGDVHILMEVVSIFFAYSGIFSVCSTIWVKKKWFLLLFFKITFVVIYQTK